MASINTTAELQIEVHGERGCIHVRPILNGALSGGVLPPLELVEAQALGEALLAEVERTAEELGVSIVTTTSISKEVIPA